MKYPFSNERVGDIQGDHKISKKCYVESLKLKRIQTLGANTRKFGSGLKLPGEARKGKKYTPMIVEEIEDLNPRGNSLLCHLIYKYCLFSLPLFICCVVVFY